MDFKLNIKDNLYYSVSDIVMEKGKGIYLYDEKNVQYIDCASGTFNLNLGYSHDEVLQEIKIQLSKLIHVSSSFQTKIVNELIKKLIRISPENINRIHLRVSGGSTANEGAIKMAQYTTGGRGIISFFRSHLGQTMMMMNISGNSFRKKNFPLVNTNNLVVPDPYCFRCFFNQKLETCKLLCVEKINDIIRHAGCGKLACMIIEPIFGNGGNIVPPDGYFQGIRKLCNENQIILIFDEIQTGIGRTGYLFALEYFKVKPDIITLAKGLSGVGLPIAAILVGDNIKIFDSFDHSFTFGNNILAAAAASKTIDIINDQRFLDNVKNVGNYIKQRLNKFREKYAFIGDVRGLGLMLGMEIVGEGNIPDVKLTNHIIEKGLEFKLIMRSSQYGYGNVVKIRPPLIITMEEADELCYNIKLLFDSINSAKRQPVSVC